MTTATAIPVDVKKKSSRYVALRLKDNKVLAEGTTVAVVIKRAEQTGEEYSLMFVPKPGTTYIY